MTVPFMRAYTELLVKTCHGRGAFTIGGMSAFIPNHRDPEVTARAVEKVSADKKREAGDGFDGTWVAHPYLIPVAQAEFDAVLGTRPNQLDRQRDDVQVRAEDLLDMHIGRPITAEGVRDNISVAIRYIEAWLRGLGAVAIDNLMGNAATAEISRSQVWQWIHQDCTTADGTPITVEQRGGADPRPARHGGPPRGRSLRRHGERLPRRGTAREFPAFLTTGTYAAHLLETACAAPARGRRAARSPPARPFRHLIGLIATDFATGTPEDQGGLPDRRRRKEPHDDDRGPTTSTATHSSRSPYSCAPSAGGPASTARSAPSAASRTTRARQERAGDAGRRVDPRDRRRRLPQDCAPGRPHRAERRGPGLGQRRDRRSAPRRQGLGTNPRKSAKTGAGEEGVVLTIAGARFRPGARLYADADVVLVER